MTFAERLKELRKEKKLTLDDVAREIGVQRATIYKYEHGMIANVPQEKTAKLAELLGVSRMYLMGWTDDRTEETEDVNEHLDHVVPKTIEAKIVSYGIDQLPKEQREQILNVFRAMCSNHPEIFQERK